jgi:hypothetical protein
MRLLSRSAVNKRPSEEDAINRGAEKTAATPKPPPKPAAPDPAMVCTEAVARVMERMRCPLDSATYKVEKEASKATPRGELNEADVPIPFAPPGAPLPAKVETKAVANTMWRILWFAMPSATKSALLGCHTALVGLPNRAAVPAPSAKPEAPLPASVETTAVKSTTLRIRKPVCSTI